MESWLRGGREWSNISSPDIKILTKYVRDQGEGLPALITTLVSKHHDSKERYLTKAGLGSSTTRDRLYTIAERMLILGNCEGLAAQDMLTSVAMGSSGGSIKSEKASLR